ncbi:F-box/RNI-like/FBD-like superfamily protein-containing protein [Thalictrum thalictroides]|uniref:F-box/RNI-like/FBD-like superfamily protein-containing protein n=1 Tax=Thalictrum thalictroides TaxID=46969 RepID=A0A7J6V3J4_THATH|nr:F-box/RNI-like/FBD-like superfamily protein-containing protein [Thalictrum thalictroides]
MAFSSSDRLSCLSDDLLLQILSYLDMKKVVQTSVLSKRWRYVWKSLTVLNLNNQNFTNKLNYEKFIIQVLRDRDRSLSVHKISACYELCYHDEHGLGSWILTALSRNTIQELHLLLNCRTSNLRYYTSNLVISFIFSYDSLRSLHLESIMGKIKLKIQLPPLIDLPLLTNLRLTSIHNISTEFLDKIFSGCPVLESLHLLNCEVEGSGTKSLTISSRQLKHLVVDIHNLHKSLQFIVVAPNLISFECRHLHETSDFISKEDVESIITCLERLSNITSLTLDRSLLKVLSLWPGELRKSQSPFVFLRYLKLSTSIKPDSLPALIYLLNNSPAIESLAIDILERTHWCATIEDFWEEKLSLQHLKHVKVKDVQGYASELDFLKFLLKNSPTLEKITIFACKELRTYNEGWVKHFTHELLKYPEAPLNVKILFCSM